MSDIVNVDLDKGPTGAKFLSMVKCAECPSEKIYAHGKCRRCYNREYQRGRRTRHACGLWESGRRATACEHNKAVHHARGMCRPCYIATYQKEKKREYDARRYKDRKLNKTEPKVQERVTHSVVREAPLPELSEEALLEGLRKVAQQKTEALAPTHEEMKKLCEDSVAQARSVHGSYATFNQAWSILAKTIGPSCLFHPDEARKIMRQALSDAQQSSVQELGGITGSL
jgi:hypothetical protein